jgi:hypothetical protein
VNDFANRKVGTIFKAFKEIYKFYLHRGFRIENLHVDGKFMPLQALIQAMPGGPRVNLASSNEHVPEIERQIRVVTERARAVRCSLPFSRIPKLLMIHLIFNCVKLLNHFPAKGGILDTLSPKTIMTGKTLHYKKHLSLQMGSIAKFTRKILQGTASYHAQRAPFVSGPAVITRRVQVYELELNEEDCAAQLGCHPNAQHHHR